MVRHLLDLTELRHEEAIRLLELTAMVKNLKNFEVFDCCRGKTAALIFEKPSTRTRVSLECALAHLGAHPVVLSSSEMQLSRGEDIKDTARVLSRYVDAVCARVNNHETLVEMSRFSDVPVINALSDKHHPLQALADVFTLYERKKSLDFKIAYIGDGNNVCHSLIIASAVFGFKIAVSTPAGYEPDKNVVLAAQKINYGTFEFYSQPEDAVRGADAIYTDTWVSMGFDNEREKRIRDFERWRVTQKLMELAKGAYFMHCLPAHKGEEVEEEVFESSNSIVFDQAENRLHTATALFLWIWKEVG